MVVNHSSRYKVSVVFGDHAGRCVIVGRRRTYRCLPAEVDDAAVRSIQIILQDTNSSIPAETYQPSSVLNGGCFSLYEVAENGNITESETDVDQAPYPDCHRLRQAGVLENHISTYNEVLKRNAIN